MITARAIISTIGILLVGSATAPLWSPVIDLISFFAAAVGRFLSTKLLRIMTIPIELLIGFVLELLGGVGLFWNLYSRVIVLEQRMKHTATLHEEIKELRELLQDFRNEFTELKTIQESARVQDLH